MTKYADKLKDPRWQKKRLEIFERDGWKCQECGDMLKPLNVHHKQYHKGYEPWEYSNDELTTLCEWCHHLSTIFHSSVTTYPPKDKNFIKENPHLYQEFKDLMNEIVDCGIYPRE